MLRVTRAPKNERRRRILNVITALILFVGFAGAAVALAVPANAAAQVFGYDTAGVGGGFLGAVRGPDGMLAYCIDPVGLFPSGATDSGTDVTSISARTAADSGGHGGTAAVSGVGIQKLNYSLAKFGESADSDNAAASEAAYVYSITADYPYPTSDPQANVTYYIRARVPAADRAAVQAGYAAINAEVDAHYASTAPAGSTTTVHMSPHPSLSGTVTVTVSPAASTGTLVLVGAVIAGTTDTTTPVVNGQVVPITATALTGPHLYEVTARSTFTVPTVPLTVVHLYTTGSPAYAQRDISVGGYFTGTVTSSNFAIDPNAGQFEPVISTAVESKFVSAGDSVVDELTAGIDPNSSQPWETMTTGSYVPIDAYGTLYCSLPGYPVVGELIPTSAVASKRVHVTLTGPGSYSTGEGVGCARSGYATWLWTIDSSSQTNELAQKDLPSGYLWSDTFGAPAETTFVRDPIRASSQVRSTSTGLYQPSNDTLHVADDSDGVSWPSDTSGNPIAINFTGTAYWYPGADSPAETADAPASAQVVAMTSVTVTGPGDYPAPDVIPTEHSAGYLVWQWASPQTDYTEAWTEDFGDVTQITRISPPTMTSTAAAFVTAGTKAADAVTIAGEPMGEPAALSWSLYFQASGSPARCDQLNEVFQSAGPVMVPGAGSFEVPDAPVLDRPGDYFWVATLTSADGSVIDKGECGDATETTRVLPHLATTGQPVSPLGILSALLFGIAGIALLVLSRVRRGLLRSA